MAWQALIPYIASALSAGAGAYGSKQAADAAKKGNDQATQAQINSLLALLQMSEPGRAMGYQAMGDLSSLYGYNMAPYPTYGQIAGTVTGQGPGFAGGGGGIGSIPKKDTSSGIPTYAGQNSIFTQVTGLKTPGNAIYDSLFGGTQPFWRDKKTGEIVFNGAEGGKKFYGGRIDPATGTVTLNNDPDGMQAALQEYLRTGQGELPKEASRFIKAVEAMKKSGWDYGAAQSAQDFANWTPGGGPIKPNAAGEYAYADGMVPTSGVPNSGTANPTAGNFDRFFASPDYQFRQQEGVKALDRGAAARGGVLSGNRLRAGTELSSNLAAGEFGNYFNRLMAMVTGTQANTTNSQNAIMNTGGNLAQLAQDNGLARASGIMGMGNSIMNGVNSGINAYYLNKYLGK